MSLSILQYFSKKPEEGSAPTTAQGGKTDLQASRKPEGDDAVEAEAPVDKQPSQELENKCVENGDRPASKRHRPLQDSKRQVTFNSSVQEKHESQAATEAVQEAADIVVHYLDPLYSQGKFATKDLFKSCARFLSHLLTEGRSCGRGQVKAEARGLIQKLFGRVQRCESEADWQPLRGAVGGANGAGAGLDKQHEAPPLSPHPGHRLIAEDTND
ncbi:hypothetical protein ANANG_G00297580 [Anguilla anguilla]|uniref:Set2 Rpb1 interacting domain-containing protein n=1 Tax=Anguilla anguilla TaxID=7936 RepID=A0A9D3LQ04_ANGAN|nr:hypothetical protein ANANG_G00297580 [Anguilla anguilla]